MNPADCYQHLACIFSYPEEKESLQTAADSLVHCLAGRDIDDSLTGFAEFITASDLAGIQEEYVRTFDFNPLCAPYVGHHLHGDTYKKGLFMMTLKEFYRAHEYTPLNSELPDHLSILFDCAAHLGRTGDHAARHEFIAGQVSAGVEKMHAVIAVKEELIFRHSIAAAYALCKAECEEVSHAG